MTGRPHALRLVALLAAAALGVHQLRYAASHGVGTEAALRAEGHAYLPFAAALVAALLGVALVGLLQGVCRGAATRVGRSPASAFGRLWALSSAVLVAAYTSQELVEGELSAAHAGGLHGVFGHGGWSALPIAIALAFLVALAARGADAALAPAGRSPMRPVRPSPRAVGVPADPAIRPLLPLARHEAARAPPLR